MRDLPALLVSSNIYKIPGMAQRVYLIPIKQELVLAFNAMLRASPSQEDEIWKRIRKYAMRQMKLASLSHRWARGLSEAKFAAAGRLDEYYECTATRPYFITAKEPGDVAAIVTALRSCRNEQEAAAIFDEQAKAFGNMWSPPEEDRVESSPDEEWQALKRNVQKLKQMNLRFQERRPFTIEVFKTATLEGTDLQVMSMDETEPQEIPWSQIPTHYAQLLGSTLGQVAGLCEPTWWMGRNYWIGLLCFSRLGVVQKLKYGKLQKRILDLSANPAVLFPNTGMLDFEKAFDLTCPAYSTGLLFGGDKMAPLLESLQQSRGEWEQLSAHITGYTPIQVSKLVNRIEEAVLWAKSENCALLEGDELVGGLGYR
jgi:hypothetical protein